MFENADQVGLKRSRRELAAAVFLDKSRGIRSHHGMFRHPRVLGAGLLAFTLASRSAFADSDLARRAEDFVEAIGVNVPTGNLDALDLDDIGIRHYRASLQVTPASSINDGFVQHGLRGMFLGSGNQNPTMANEVSAVKAIDPGAVDAFEGPNEVNNTFGSCNCNFKYGGKQDAAAAIAYMNDLHAAFQADPALAKIPILSFTQVYFLANYAPNLAGKFPFDIENFHPYPAYGPVNYGLYGQTATLDLAGKQYGSLGYNRAEADAEQVGDGGAPRPIVASETGYVQTTYGPLDQGKYASYMFADYFQYGVKRAYYFTLTHSGDGFGLMDASLVKRPAWYSIKDLIGILREATWDPNTRIWAYPSFDPETLDLTLTSNADSGVADHVNHVVLEKSNGDFFVLFWNEVLAYEVNTKKEITNATKAMTLSVTSPSFDGATVWTRSDATGHFASTNASLNGGSLTIAVPDSMMVVQLHRTPQPVSEGGSDAAPDGSPLGLDDGGSLEAGSPGASSLGDGLADGGSLGATSSHPSGCACHQGAEPPGTVGFSLAGALVVLLRLRRARNVARNRLPRS